MELIIKPTGRCNFNCTFCSAGNLNIKHQEKVPEELKNILSIIKPDGLIMTGGDPLLMSPEYYNELLKLGSWNISFTTNLKDFYLYPDKWKTLLKNNRVSVCTSFQYGNNRLWDKNTIYTEDLFKKVMYKFNEYIGYFPPFIAVIDHTNEDFALKHLELAKELNTKCKLNGMLCLGKAKESYPKYKMIDIWLKAYELNLDKYLDTEIQFKYGGCSFNTNLMCKSTIRAFWLTNTNKIIYGNCEDLATGGEYIEIDKEKPKIKKENISIKDLISQKCLTCELCNLCNGCKKSRDINKNTVNFCEEMLKRKEKILKMPWKI